MATCWKCHDTLPGGAAFCISCGAERAAPETTRLDSGTARPFVLGSIDGNVEYEPPRSIGSAEAFAISVIHDGTHNPTIHVPYTITAAYGSVPWVVFRDKAWAGVPGQGTVSVLVRHLVKGSAS